MSEKRDRLKDVLKKYSADGPIADVAAVRKFYKQETGDSINKHTVIDTLESFKALDQCDYDEIIDTQNHRVKTNIVFNRDLQTFEAKLIADQIASLAYIPVDDREALMSRLRSVAGVGDKKGFEEFAGAKVLEDNLSTQFMETVHKLYTATYIEKRQLSFVVNKNQYEWQEREAPRDYDPVHPLTMAFHEGFYYLYCHLGDSDAVYSFRVDLIKDIKTVGEINSREMRISEDELASIRRSPFVGKQERVVVRFSPAYTTYILDRFGYSTPIKKPKNSAWAEIETKAVTYGLEYWALRFIPNVEIVEPKHVRERIIEMLDNNPYKER